MWIDLPNIWIIVLNVLGIPAVHLIIAWWSTKMPEDWFQRCSEAHPNKPSSIYENVFFVRKWKHLLPDAAPWFKGFPKGSMQSADPDYLRKFISETRRGEFSHWLQVLLITGIIAWNPYPANWIIIGYALLANLPCILNLRYTRQRMLCLLAKK